MHRFCGVCGICSPNKGSWWRTRRSRRRRSSNWRRNSGITWSRNADWPRRRYSTIWSSRGAFWPRWSRKVKRRSRTQAADVVDFCPAGSRPASSCQAGQADDHGGPVVPRYARYRGLIEADLKPSVPAVANWSMASLPRPVSGRNPTTSRQLRAGDRSRPPQLGDPVVTRPLGTACR